MKQSRFARKEKWQNDFLFKKILKMLTSAIVVAARANARMKIVRIAIFVQSDLLVASCSVYIWSIYRNIFFCF